jgi:hypothetical protein
MGCHRYRLGYFHPVPAVAPQLVFVLTTDVDICVCLLLPSSCPPSCHSPYMYFRSPSQSLAHDRNLTSYYKALQEQQARGELQVGEEGGHMQERGCKSCRCPHMQFPDVQ